jgi:hypothetical protein
MGQHAQQRAADHGLAGVDAVEDPGRAHRQGADQQREQAGGQQPGQGLATATHGDAGQPALRVGFGVEQQLRLPRQHREERGRRVSVRDGGRRRSPAVDDPEHDQHRDGRRQNPPTPQKTRQPHPDQRRHRRHPRRSALMSPCCSALMSRRRSALMSPAAPLS